MANQDKSALENLKEVSDIWSGKKILRLNDELHNIKSKLDNVLRDFKKKKEAGMVKSPESKSVDSELKIEKGVKEQNIEKEFTQKSKSDKGFQNDRSKDFNQGQKRFEKRFDNNSNNNFNKSNFNKDNKNNKINNTFNKENNEFNKEYKNSTKQYQNKPFDKAPKISEPVFIIENKPNNRTINKIKDKRNFNNENDGPKKQIRIKNFDDESGDQVYSRKLKTKKEKNITPQVSVITKATMTTEMISVKDLSEKIGKPAVQIIKQLFILGDMATINSSIDYDTASLVSSELGVDLELKLEKSYEEQLNEYVHTANDADAEPRPPIVTIMGHVDHGKTSLLDFIRKSKVVSTEAGGITQHIGAYSIEKDGRKITFIDTPGHAAFTAMRARGAKVTDVAVLVVAGDDGVMPQTVEAISHIKQANVPMIVAVNKMDKPTFNIERIKQQLSEYDVIPEEWGGDVVMVPVSAKTGEGVDKLLEMILLVSDMEELKANPKRPAVGTIIEARLDRGRGPVATVLVENGTLKIGNTLVCGTTLGRVRAMIDDTGKNVVSAGPSTAVAVLGMEDVPNAGDSVQVVDEKFSKQIIQERKAKLQLEKIKSSGGASLEEFMKSSGDLKNLNIIVKGDVQGSVEALKSSITELSNSEVRVNCIHSGVGAVTETDVLLAQASSAMIVAFNVKVEGKLEKLAEKSDVEIKSYKIIYEALDDITHKIKGLQKPKYKRNALGTAEVRMVYKITGAGLVAGCYIKNGVIKRNAIATIVRDGEVISETVVESIKIFKDDVREVKEGFECGIKLKDAVYKEGDIIEAFEDEEIAD